MAGAALLGRLNWRICTVVDAAWETPSVRSLVFDCPDWPGHLPGQHVDVRLTAEDGYQAERSYSIANPVDDGRITLTIQRLDDGEVSPYLCDELVLGDGLELRGPIGGYFVWRPDVLSPALLVAGGSGIVPLMAMVRGRVSAPGYAPMRLLVSVRSYEEVIYRAELDRLAKKGGGFELFETLTRSHPADWTGYTRRVDGDMLQEVAWPMALGPIAYVCGPTGFVESVADALVELGYRAEHIFTERFGPTGV